MNSSISVIIPFKKSSVYLSECLEALSHQSYIPLEVILLSDKKTGPLGPAQKRDLGAGLASGEILAFIDDDAYPDRDWLLKAKPSFQNPDLAAVCGPGVTPSNDSLLQKAGGYVNSLWLGSGGAGTYRFIPQKKRFVDDYPSMNFLVRKKDFLKAGGFDTHFWPGEDTKLCYNLVYLLKKKILYDPQVLVYHHRKPLFTPHLKQISRFALHRGHFARILPKTSFRLGYLLPTFFVLFLIFGLIASLFNKNFAFIYLFLISLYFLLLILSVAIVIIRSRNLLIAILTGLGIFLTHIFYGILFPWGFFKKTLRR